MVLALGQHTEKKEVKGKIKCAGNQRLNPVILAIWEGKMGRTVIQDQPKAGTL
jgi:hypothetical protein